MEFPYLGKHCSEKSCNKLDFLPMSCDACQLVFCSSHFNYQKHNCTSAYKKDVQVPACPLCGAPVPTPRGISPDMTVGQHIDQHCRSDKSKVFHNRCSFKNCRRKELVPVRCNECKLNFCFRHRFTTDHDCNPNNARRHLLAAVSARQTSKSDGTANGTSNSDVAAQISEDEALAQALARSIQELDESHDRNRRNQQQKQTVPCAGGGSDSGGGGSSSSTSTKDKCSLS